MPSATDFSCGQSRVVCGPSHAEAGPWQDSQETPSEISNGRPRCSGVVFSAWQARHLGDCSAVELSFRMRAMRSPTSPVSTWYARLCLSCNIHVEYSFCKMRLPAIGLTLPWQLVAAQEPGPMYFTGSLVSVAGEPTVAKAQKRTAHKSGGREYL